jgi:hypothetical protein
MTKTSKTISKIDNVEVVGLGYVQVRRADMEVEDDVVVSVSYHRHTLSPGDDLSGEADEVVAAAREAWTQEVVAKYQNMISAKLPAINNEEE